MTPNKKIKILIVCDYFYPHWTGISKSLFNLVQSISETFDTTVLTVRYSPDLKSEEKIQTTTILREGYLFGISRAKYSAQILLKFIRIVSQYDIVFINSPFTNVLFIAIMTKVFGKKLIIFHQGDLVMPPGFLNTTLEKFFDFSSYGAFFLADTLSCYTKDYAQVSRVLKPFLHKFYPFLMPIALDTQSGTKSQEKIKKLQTLPREHKYLFGFAGRFVEEKGFDILLDAIPLIQKKLPDAHFVFAGETNIFYENFYQQNEDKLQKLQSSITLLGLLDDRALQKFYSVIDFAIIPSRSDCFNLVQAEAMLLKTPVIVSNIPGARYLVNETGFGKVFKSEDPIDLANTLLQAVKEKKSIMVSYKNAARLLKRDSAKEFTKLITR